MTPEDAIKIINDLFADQKAELQHDNMVDLVMKLLIKQFPDYGWFVVSVGRRCLYDVHAGNTASPMSADRPWRPIATAPANQWVEVRGTHGMETKMRPKMFMCIACKMVDYRPLNPWRDLQNDALSDYGWEPLEWRKLEE